MRKFRTIESRVFPQIFIPTFFTCSTKCSSNRSSIIQVPRCAVIITFYCYVTMRKSFLSHCQFFFQRREGIVNLTRVLISKKKDKAIDRNNINVSLYFSLLLFLFLCDPYPDRHIWRAKDDIIRRKKLISDFQRVSIYDRGK